MLNMEAADSRILLALIAFAAESVSNCPASNTDLNMLDMAKASMALAPVMSPADTRFSDVVILCESELDDSALQTFNDLILGIGQDLIVTSNVLPFVSDEDSLDERSVIIVGDEASCSALNDSIVENSLTLLPKSCQITDLDLTLKSQLIPYRSLGKSLLFEETYAIKGGTPIIRRLGWWSNGKQRLLLEDHSHIWERRKNLGDVQLINMFLPYEPLHFWSEEEGRHIGAMSDMLSALEESLNFTTVYVEPEDQAWGGLDQDGKTKLPLIE